MSFGVAMGGFSGGYDEEEDESYETKASRESNEDEIESTVQTEIDEDEWKRRVMEDLVESFSIFDIDGDGKISVQELMAVMASVGKELSHEDAEDIFELVDVDGDGEISFEEFKECMYEKLSQQTIDEDLEGAFRIFDEDGDGYISPTEIQLLFKKLGELITTDEAVEIMKDCDLNQDGLIDFDEFKIFYLKIFDSQPTLAQQIKEEESLANEEELAKAAEEKERAQFPPASVPSPTDYK